MKGTIHRRQCIDYYGSNCKVCGFNFEETYGEFARECIHVHNVVPLSEVNK